MSAVRLAGGHAACDILGLEETFDEEHLYRNLDWLEEQHAQIEQRLYQELYPAGKRPELFLYDVTSTHMEGAHNAWAAFGYNRDGKKGQMQIIVGLLCDQQGRPLAIEVFAGLPGRSVAPKPRRRWKYQPTSLKVFRGSVFRVQEMPPPEHRTLNTQNVG